MVIERVTPPGDVPARGYGSLSASGGDSTGAAAPASSKEHAAASPELRLSILSTEHWNLLATRSLSWNESFTRVGTFLNTLSAAVVALAFIANATDFGSGFVLSALLLLPVVLFLGLTTFARIVHVNMEDMHWVVGMNRIRHAYLEIAPELEPYFITGHHDDTRSVMLTMAPTEPASDAVSLGGLVRGFTTVPGTLAMINSVVAGAAAGALLASLGLGIEATVAAAAGAFLACLVWLLVLGARTYHAKMPDDPRFPGPTVEARPDGHDRAPETTAGRVPRSPLDITAQ